MDIEIERPAVGDVRACRVEIQLVEQILLHEGPVTLRVRRPQAHVFVEIERRHLREVETFFLVQSDKLAVRAQRRIARGQSQHAAGFFADQFGHKPCRTPAGGICIAFDDDTHGENLLWTNLSGNWRACCPPCVFAAYQRTRYSNKGGGTCC